MTSSTLADSEGCYHFPPRPGRYDLKTEATGFCTASLTGIVLDVGTRLDTNVALTVGNVQEQITVTADAPTISLTSGDVSGVVTQQQIDTLPVNTRQYVNLALLMPGTTQDASRTFYNNVQRPPLV